MRITEAAGIKKAQAVRSALRKIDLEEVSEAWTTAYSNGRENGLTINFGLRGIFSQTLAATIAENRSSDDYVVYIEKDARYESHPSEEAYQNRATFLPGTPPEHVATWIAGEVHRLAQEARKRRQES